MAKRSLSPELIALVADRLKLLGEPARLQILNCLRARERTVSEIVDLTGLGQANVSKHLQQLHAHGVVSRRKDAQFAHYALTDRHVFELCALVCDSLDDEAESRREILTA